METIEQLKQENDKLNARLAKAVEVFKEQKAQIEQLTNEVKEKTSLDMDYRNQIEELNKENNTLKNKISELEHDADSFNALQQNYEKKISELEDSYENLGAEYQAAINCNDRNNKDLLAADEKTEELNKQLNEYELKLQNLEAEHEQLRQKYEESKELLDDSLNAGVDLGIENTDLKAKLHKLEVQYKEQEKFETEVINVKVPQLEERLKEVENVCANKDKEIESKNLFISQLQTTYDEVFADYNKLKENSISQADFDDEVNRLNATISDNVKAYKELLQQKETIEALADEFKKENDEYKVFNNKLISLIETLPHYGKQVQNKPVKNQQKTSGSHGTGNNQFMSDEPVVSL